MKTCEDNNKRLQINKIVVFVVLYIEIFIISCLFTLHKNKLFHYNVFFSLKRSVGLLDLQPVNLVMKNIGENRQLFVEQQSLKYLERIRVKFPDKYSNLKTIHFTYLEVQSFPSVSSLLKKQSFFLSNGKRKVYLNIRSSNTCKNTRTSSINIALVLQSVNNFMNKNTVTITLKEYKNLLLFVANNTSNLLDTPQEIEWDLLCENAVFLPLESD